MFKINDRYLNDIIKVELWGTISIDESIQIATEFKRIRRNKLLILTDVKNAVYGWDVNDLKFLNESITYKCRIKYEAILVDDPKKHALTLLYNDTRDKKNHIIEFFVTEKAAINWLLSFK